MTEQKFNSIVQSLAAMVSGSRFENHVFVVGGAIRSLKLGQEPKDIDICVDLPDGGIEFANYMTEKGFTTGSVVTYPTYGVAMFRLVDFPDEEIECVMTRGEQYHDKTSRNPETTFATIYDDCIRRDFTINALYMNVSTGEVMDLTGKGFDDLRNRVLRTTNDNPDVVFSDDPLRILRGIVRSAKDGFEIEPVTFESMRRNVPKLSIISQERITEEINKMLLCNNPKFAIVNLYALDALSMVLPELNDLVGLEQNNKHSMDAFAHTLAVVDGCKGNPLPVMLAALLHDIGKVCTKTEDERGVHFYGHEDAGAELAADILWRMKYPNKIIEEVYFLISNHMRLKPFGDVCPKDKYIRHLQYDCGTTERFEHLLTLIDADNKAHAPEWCLPNQVELVRKRSSELFSAFDDMFGYKLPVSGHDVMKIRGVQPGMIVKKYHDYLIKVAFTEGNKLTRERALKLLGSVQENQL